MARTFLALAAGVVLLAGCDPADRLEGTWRGEGGMGTIEFQDGVATASVEVMNVDLVLEGNFDYDGEVLTVQEPEFRFEGGGGLLDQFGGREQLEEAISERIEDPMAYNVEWADDNTITLSGSGPLEGTFERMAE